MDKEHFSEILARIDAAAGRIGRVAEARARSAGGGIAGAAADRTEGADTALRSEAEAVLAELDELIARLEA